MWLKGTVQIARKELGIFFASPLAYLFLGAFALINVFIFFWVEAFFARNIADVRPLFEWMPVVLVFLAAALTMRSWSEERRTGTLDHVLTMPARSVAFVFGKFLAAWALLLMALILTLPIPVMVSAVGDLDWGPVWAGYLATALLGALYLAIGLAVSARTDNAIVSLLLTTAVAGALLLIGHPLLTSLVPTGLADWMRLIGSGSRFESITRGVIDARDLYYYLGLTGVFLAYNVYTLEQVRWDKHAHQIQHGRWRLGIGLLVANLLLVNVWLQPTHALRVDTTEGNLYSMSDVTRQTLARLEEPLELRGYFSAKTHPLLAPLVPQLKDLLREYGALGGERVKVRLIDPTEEPELEQEANRTYGIEPVPFQVADRYQASVVSSYFNVLVKYGDEHRVLGFDDMIEVKQGRNDLNVRLRNPEYDLTRAINSVLESYRAGGEIYPLLDDAVTLTAYVSPDESLPDALVDFRATLEQTANEMAEAANGKLNFELRHPEADGGQLAQQIQQDYGFRPMIAGLLDPQPFYFYLMLSDGEQNVQVPLPDDLSANDLRNGLEAGLERFVTGLTDTIGLVTPSPGANPYMAQTGGKRFTQLRQALTENYSVRTVQLDNGQVPAEIDLLMVMAPESLSEKAVFAIDQYLMRGGRVVLATGPQSIRLSRQQLSASAHDSGLGDWLAGQSIELSDQLVMDPRNSAFPVPVIREVNGLRFEELRMLNYPYFVDVRGDGLAEHPVTSNLGRLTMPWAGAVQYTAPADEATEALSVTTLAQSSPDAWLGSAAQVMPRLNANGDVTYTPAETTERYPLIVSLTGQFRSHFAGQDSPLLDADTETDEASAEDTEAAESADTQPTIGTVIERSPESARLVVIGSNDFAEDTALQMAGAAQGTQLTGEIDFLTNLAEWSLDDSGLMSIRSGGEYNRTLPAMSEDSQRAYEYATYGAALVLLAALIVIQRWRRRQRLQQLTQWA